MRNYTDELLMIARCNSRHGIAEIMRQLMPTIWITSIFGETFISKTYIYIHTHDDIEVFSLLEIAGKNTNFGMHIRI